MDEREINKKLNKLLQGFLKDEESTKELEMLNIMSIVSLPMSLKNNTRLYRVRDFYSFNHNNIKKDNIFNIKSFSYPPKGSGGVSRAATKDFPLFYASSTYNAAVEECRLSNNLFYLSTWSVNETIKIRPFLSNIPEIILNDPSLQLKQIKEKLEEEIKGLSSENQRLLKTIDDFHNTIFLKNNPNIYNYTSWLGYMNLYYPRIKKLQTIPDAIVYQSVIDPDLGTNFAIYPDFVDKYLKLQEIYLIHLNHDSTSKHCVIIAEGEITNNTEIKWKSLNERQIGNIYERLLIKRI